MGGRSLMDKFGLYGSPLLYSTLHIHGTVKHMRQCKLYYSIAFFQIIILITEYIKGGKINTSVRKHLILE